MGKIETLYRYYWIWRFIFKYKTLYCLLSVMVKILSQLKYQVVFINRFSIIICFNLIDVIRVFMTI